MFLNLQVNSPRLQILALDRWSLGAFLLSILILGPIIAILVAAFGDSGELWLHLLNTVLGRYVYNTVTLMAGVGALAIFFGVTSAWVVNRYQFFGQNVFEWMLLLPAAIPAYIIAYAYTEFFEYAGPFQTLLRSVFGWQTSNDYWFPEVRSINGAILVMASVLYPYIYMVTRIAFRLTPSSLFEIAIVHNRSQFWDVGLPLARPAIMAGLALVLMEVVSDFGTVEFFAIETITLGIFNVWIGMNNLVAAAQISLVGFVFILGLLGLELYARSRQQYVANTAGAVSLKPLSPSKVGTILCWLVCIIPLILGFFLPVSVLISLVSESDIFSNIFSMRWIIYNTLLVSVGGAALIMLVSTYVVLSAKFRAGARFQKMVLLASTGYAFPGTILAIGVLIFIGAIDKSISSFFSDELRGCLIASPFVLIFAYLVRFQAIGYGAITSGIKRLPENLMNASRILGKGYLQSLKEIILPLLRSSIFAGVILVFVDIMKELPMTLLLRSFNFETLATYTYQYAKDEMIEVAALPALMIVFSGLIPVIFMSSMLRRYR